MHISFILFDATGKIIQTGICEKNALEPGEGQIIVEGKASDALQYMIPNPDYPGDQTPVEVAPGIFITPEPLPSWIPADKTEMPRSINKTTVLANGTDLVSITGLPMTCTVYLNNERHDVDDGAFEFTVDTPGKYQVLIQAFPYLDYSVEVTAT